MFKSFYNCKTISIIYIGIIDFFYLSFYIFLIKKINKISSTSLILFIIHFYNSKWVFFLWLWFSKNNRSSNRNIYLLFLILFSKNERDKEYKIKFAIFFSSKIIF